MEVTIMIEDINDNPPEFVGEPYQFTREEANDRDLLITELQVLTHSPPLIYCE